MTVFFIVASFSLANNDVCMWFPIRNKLPNLKLITYNSILNNINIYLPLKRMHPSWKLQYDFSQLQIC